MRLYAKIEAVEKYGGSSILIERMPMILEERLENEKQSNAPTPHIDSKKSSRSAKKSK